MTSIKIGRKVRSTCCCSSKHPTCEMHVSVSISYWPVARGSTGICRFISSFFKFSTAFILAVVREGNNVGCFFHNFLFNDAATAEKFGKNGRIHRKGPRRILIPSESRNPLVLVRLLLSPQNVLVVPTGLHDRDE